MWVISAEQNRRLGVEKRKHTRREEDGLEGILLALAGVKMVVLRGGRRPRTTDTRLAGRARTIRTTTKTERANHHGRTDDATRREDRRGDGRHEGHLMRIEVTLEEEEEYKETKENNSQ